MECLYEKIAKKEKIYETLVFKEGPNSNDLFNNIQQFKHFKGFFNGKQVKQRVKTVQNTVEKFTSFFVDELEIKM